MSVRILHITTSDSGGAGLAALRLHQALLSQKIDSKMLVVNKTSDLSSVYVAKESNLNRFVLSSNRLIRKLQKTLRRRGYFLSRIEKYEALINKVSLKHRVFFTFPITHYDLSENPLVKEASIIHLHWIANFVDFETFFRKVNKPIVWTLHDLSPFYGGFHHYRLRERFYPLYKTLEDEFYEIKRSALQNNKNITMIAVSDQMQTLISKHEFFQNKKIYQIHNSVDQAEFKYIENARGILDLPQDKVILLFVNRSLNDTEKGLKELLSALDIIEMQNLLLICVGEGTIESNHKFEIKHYHAVNNSVWLSILYSSADILVMPSFQEAFAQTPLEAMSCGIPVVMFPVSGSDDLINENNGIKCSDFSINALLSGIKKAIGHKYNSIQIRKDVIDRFNSELIAKKYDLVYDDVISYHTTFKM